MPTQSSRALTPLTTADTQTGDDLKQNNVTQQRWLHSNPDIYAAVNPWRIIGVIFTELVLADRTRFERFGDLRFVPRELSESSGSILCDHRGQFEGEVFRKVSARC